MQKFCKISVTLQLTFQLFLLIFLSLTVSVPIFAGPPGASNNPFLAYNQGLDQLRQGQAEEAEDFFSVAVSRHKDVMQCLFGVAFSLNNENQRAVDWLTLSAEAGFAPASYFLARLACHNTLDKKELNAAEIHFKNAFAQEFLPSSEVLSDIGDIAANGGVYAQFMLGQSFYFAMGCQPDYASAAYWFDKAAVNGCASATFYLGAMHLLGQHFTHNQEKGLALLTEASITDPAARLILGKMYIEGAGLTRDVTKALQFADFKSPSLAAFQLEIGYALLMGKDMEKNEAEATRWFLMAAENGNVRANREVGLAYMLGRGIEQDSEASRMWNERFRVASEQKQRERFAVLPHVALPAGLQESIEFIEHIAAQGFNARQISSQTFIVSETMEASHSMTLRAGVQVAAALERLSVANQDSESQKESRKIVELLKTAADQGSVAAQVFMAGAYRDGFLVERNPLMEGECLKKAAAGGSAIARQMLIERQLFFKITQMAADSGNTDSQLMMYHLLYSGFNGAKDSAGSMKWLKLAAKNMNMNACVLLGRCYLIGEDSEKDVAAAHKLLQMAASDSEILQKGVADIYRDAGFLELALQNYLAIEQGGGNMAPLAAIELVRFFSNGTGVEKSEARAAEFVSRIYPAYLNAIPDLRTIVKELADKGFSGPQFLLAESIIEESRNEEDPEAVKLIRMAAAGGHIKAQSTLANLLCLGDLATGKDFVQAYVWASRACASGSKDSAETLEHLKIVMNKAQIEEAETILKNKFKTSQ